ncbi:odorant receptor 67a-like [Aricia agestis]|uniref:odorant receptor 67a-like n=1 Tax=Aricia agestis TaxID=91739 RepID=UPI001C209907|nr:odorant receptor 67a-like [Aricia agestis]
MKTPKSLLKNIQDNLKEASVESILWCINLTPRIAGFSITSRRISGIQVNTEINKLVCRVIILSQDAIMSVVVINYQSLLLFLIAHTAAMFDLIAEEMKALNILEGLVDNGVKEKLASLIKRHILLLHIVQCLRDLYSLPLGIDFAANAYCMCLFFSLPLEDWISFAPVLGYCFLVFFLYCYLCQKLVDVSEVFEASVYDCGWENYVLSDRRSVLIVLLQAQQPVMIKAGNIVPVNIYTFASAMQGIYKFVTALKF